MAAQRTHREADQFNGVHSVRRWNDECGMMNDEYFVAGTFRP
jgi:hypothetical protein